MNTHNDPNTQNRSSRDILVRALAVIGVIALLIFALWGTVQVVRFAPQVISAAAVTISSIFQPAERIDISVPAATLPHAEVFTLSWEHVGKDDDAAGTYTISYPCRDGFHFEAIQSNGTFDRTFCDTPFNFVGATERMRLIPISTKNRFVDIPVVVTFTPDDSSKEPVASEVTLTFENPAISTSPDTNGDDDSGSGSDTTGGGETRGDQTTDTRVISGGRSSDPNGQIDLAVRITEIGVLDGRTTDTFRATSTVQVNQRAAVKFEIENLGTKVSPEFTFTAVLPTKSIHIFDSKTQPRLFPGDRIEYVMGFDQIRSTGDHEMTINVDPRQRITEASESNNIQKVTFTVFR